MSILEQMKAERIKAMKDKDQLRKATLTTLIGDAETINKGPNGPIDDAGVVALVKKHITGLEEMAQHDPTDRCKEEIDVLSYYLPRQMSRDEIELMLFLGIERGEVKNIGDAMKLMKELHAGKYDGKMASTVAKELLT